MIPLVGRPMPHQMFMVEMKDKLESHVVGMQCVKLGFLFCSEVSYQSRPQFLT